MRDLVVSTYLNVVPTQNGGIEVHEERWATVSVSLQFLYKVRCECGRSWFALERPRVVKCPACHKFGLVPKVALRALGEK
jgi:hypothetical protein